MQVVRRTALGALALVFITASPPVARAAPGLVDTVVANDNTRPAGIEASDLVSIRLRAGMGRWQPEGPSGPALTIEAFGEEGAALSVPAPLIRVTEGRTIAVSIRNELPAGLRVNGLCTREGGPCPPLDVPPGVTREVRFAAGRAGTYHYWASTVNAPFPFRELAGGLVIDAANEEAGRDRVFVITEWTSLTPAQLAELASADIPNEAFLGMRPGVVFVINGLSWPATERLTYRRDQPVRWRVINLSSQTHPMHLHGFYFTVTRAGNGRHDEPLAGGAGRRVVTHVLPSGGTMALEWTPEREGNWLFHCHVMHHVSPERRFVTGHSEDAHASHDVHHEQGGSGPALGMAGMVLGITVVPPNDAPRSFDRRPAPAPRRLTMAIDRGAGGADEATAGFAISEAGQRQGGTAVASPGPPLVMRRNEPVEITVVNRLTEATSIHWHGLELDSVYDGVHGWSGIGRDVAPMIGAGESFIVRITPPRTGTFIYHTHLHEYRQLSSGLYGPLIVIEPGETYDAATDHAVVLGRARASDASALLEDADSAVINGEHAPRWVWRAGARHRIRVINITPDDVLQVSLVARDADATWVPLTKDGAPVPPDDARPSPAQVRIAVGETYDFEYHAPPGRATLWLEVRSASGKWQAQGRITVR
jgi:FtsP/CotA-like multicopper oxidase with cupredoxin domain